MVTVRLKEKDTGIESKEVDIEEIIFNQSEVEFIFSDDELDTTQLPYKDFLFFQNDYQVIIRTSDKNE